jgi:hypothetical protein
LPLLIKEGSYMFVFGLIEVARDFVSEIDPYTLAFRRFEISVLDEYEQTYG